MNLIRIMLLMVAIAAGVIVLYGLLVERSSIKLPLIVSGLAVGGVCLGWLGFSLARSAAGLADRGRVAVALLVAFVGGLCVLGASGSLAAAIVLGILAWAG